jgi:hypothetical protein
MNRSENKIELKKKKKIKFTTNIFLSFPTNEYDNNCFNLI